MDKEEVPPINVMDIDDEEAWKEAPLLVKKNSNKSVVVKGKGKVHEKEIPSEEDEDVEKEKGEKRPLRKRK